MNPGFAVEWTRCAPWLEAALEKSGCTHTLGDVLTEIVENRAHFVPGERAAVVVQVLRYPRRRVLRIWLAGGDLDEVLAMLPSADAWAVACGCDGIEMEGRQGWSRVLKAHGYTTTKVVMEKDLRDGPEWNRANGQHAGN